MQETNPLPWGAQDRYQAHFIVRRSSNENNFDYAAKTILKTKGHFGSKQVTDVTWNGGRLAKVLNEDTSLKEMILLN